jgi:hypothetical protein
MSEAKSPEALWRLVCYDLETVPNSVPKLMRDGRSIPDPHTSSIVQIAFCDFEGNPIIPNLNLNPEIDWKNVKNFTSYVKRAWDVDTEDELPHIASELPTFADAMPGVLLKLLRVVGPRIILTAHNGRAWDDCVLGRQMREAGLRFPFEVKAFDTRYIAHKLRLKDKKERKWKLSYVYQRAFGEKIKDAHTALPDAVALARIVRAHASDKGIKTEAACVEQLRFEKGMRLAAFPGCEMLQDRGEPDEFEADFKEMVETLKKQKARAWKDKELASLYEQMSALVISKKSV